MEDGSNFIYCSEENQFCNFSGEMTVNYSDNYGWGVSINHNHTGGVQCTYQNFQNSDPLSWFRWGGESIAHCSIKCPDFNWNWHF